MTTLVLALAMQLVTGWVAVIIGGGFILWYTLRD